MKTESKTPKGWTEIEGGMEMEAHTAGPWRFCIMSPNGSAKFLALNEAEADSISMRLTSVGLKNEIQHIEAARDRDPHGVAYLVSIERDKEKSTDQLKEAAPELLEALEACKMELEILAEMFPKQSEHRRLALVIATEAIAKAKGLTQ